ncbi:MAG: nucleotidyltransferase domain-containing protein [Treponema sp.]|nr:nucleotidyltransferase domain-containing protein [Treponema sp.]
MKNEALVSDLVENLKAADPYKIVLFGSCARDKMTADSDIDLMVVLGNAGGVSHPRVNRITAVHISRRFPAERGPPSG